jgi:hypothetical protein
MKVNPLAVLVAALSSFVLGFLWYGPLFGRLWQAEAGITEAQMGAGNPVVLFGGSFILAAVAAYGVALAIQATSSRGWMAGLRVGLMVGLLFVATSLGINYLFATHGPILWGIDAGYAALMLGIMGAIIGAWPGKSGDGVSG